MNLRHSVNRTVGDSAILTQSLLAWIEGYNHYHKLGILVEPPVTGQTFRLNRLTTRLVYQKSAACTGNLAWEVAVGQPDQLKPSWAVDSGLDLFLCGTSLAFDFMGYRVANADDVQTYLQRPGLQTKDLCYSTKARQQEARHSHTAVKLVLMPVDDWMALSEPLHLYLDNLF